MGRVRQSRWLPLSGSWRLDSDCDIVEVTLGWCPTISLEFARCIGVFPSVKNYNWVWAKKNSVWVPNQIVGTFENVCVSFHDCFLHGLELEYKAA